MQHLQCGISTLSKFLVAPRLPLFSGTLRHVIFPVPSLRPASSSFPLATAYKYNKYHWWLKVGSSSEKQKESMIYMIIHDLYHT